MKQSIDQWLAAARIDVGGMSPDAHAAQRAVLRWRERTALQDVSAARAAMSSAAPAGRVRRRSTGSRRSSRLPLWFGIPLAAAGCALLLVAALALAPSGSPRAVEVAATPFIAVTSAEQIRSNSDAMVLSGWVPRLALADYGLPVDPARADQPVEAEFLMSRAGVVLAVRFKE